MILAVLDTNVLASGLLEFLQPTRAPGQVLGLWRAQAFGLVVSDHILVELARTLTQPYFRARLAPRLARRYLLLLEHQAVKTTITADVQGVAAHPQDDLVLATAVSAGAQYLATGDIKLQRLGTDQGVRLLSPRAFVEVLET